MHHTHACMHAHTYTHLVLIQSAHSDLLSVAVNLYHLLVHSLAIVAPLTPTIIV